MKFQIVVVMVLLSAIAIAAQPAKSRVRPRVSTVFEVRNTQRVQTLDEGKEIVLKMWLQQLMVSALYRDVVTESSLDEWQQALATASRIHCRYSPGTALALPERQVLEFDEVLLPLPARGYPAIYLKRGEEVLLLSKWDPWVFHTLISEAGFSLHSNLATVPRGEF